jgi:hypothetical protein
MSSLPGIYTQLPDDVQSVILSNLAAQQVEEHLINGYLERQKAIDEFKQIMFEYQSLNSLCSHDACCYCRKCTNLLLSYYITREAIPYISTKDMRILQLDFCNKK